MATYTTQTTKSRKGRKPAAESRDHISRHSILIPPPDSPRLFALIDWQRMADTGEIPRPEQILSADEAGAVLRRSRSGIYNDVNRGLLPRHVRGRSLWFLWEELENFLANDGDPQSGVTYAKRYWDDYCQRRIARMRVQASPLHPPLSDSSDPSDRSDPKPESRKQP